MPICEDASAIGAKVLWQQLGVLNAESQAKELSRLGCDQMQGYLFSKPVSFDDMTVLLGSRI